MCINHSCIIQFPRKLISNPKPLLSSHLLHIEFPFLLKKEALDHLVKSQQKSFVFTTKNIIQMVSESICTLKSPRVRDTNLAMK